MKRLQRLFPVVLIVVLCVGNVLAQSYPSKPVRIVVPMVAGGSIDALARMIGQRLTEAWKQPVLVDNRGGAGGNVGANVVAKAEPDGYTYLLAASGLAVSPNIYRKLPFDPLKDLAPVTKISDHPMILAVNANLPVTSVRELIALAKSKPGSLNYASTGVGGVPHLAAEQLKSLTGTSIVHVPYKGVAQMDTAALTNEVQVIFTMQLGLLPHLKSGKLRALAIAGRPRLQTLPDVPLITEAGLPNYELPNWLGLFAPAGTSREILSKLHAEVVKIVVLPELRDLVKRIGGDVVGSSPDEFAAMYKEDVATFARVVKDANIALQE